ncbi:MAG TPA: hypothetical protein VFD04_23720 [Actinomycetes bacterium]|jgi:hypothetical protein|nr:hypothetical protein [Actinomycetes bacterium]
MDRDNNGVPDWQEDENYADEAPLRPPYRTRARAAGGSGCAGVLAALLAATVAAGAVLKRR